MGVRLLGLYFRVGMLKPNLDRGPTLSELHVRFSAWWKSAI